MISEMTGSAAWSWVKARRHPVRRARHNDFIIRPVGMEGRYQIVVENQESFSAFLLAGAQLRNTTRWRRLAIGGTRLAGRSGCQPATQQIASLRYLLRISGR